MSFSCFVPVLVVLAAAPPPNQFRTPAAPTIRESLGVEFAVLESMFRRAIIRTRTPYGFKISKVENGSAAARAGWITGDVLLEWNGRPIHALTDLDSALKKARSGKAAKFKLARHKKEASIWSRQPWKYIEGEIIPK